MARASIGVTCSLPLGVFDELAIEGADRVERRLGKRAALRALTPLFDSTRPGRARAKMHVRMMALSGDLDPELHARLLFAWETETHGRHRELKRAVRSLLEEGLTATAASIARAEVTRLLGEYEEASAWYVLGRALEASGDRAGALEAYDRAEAASIDQPQLRRVAAVRAIRVCATVDDAAWRAGPLLPLEDGARPERLSVAVAALASPGRYRRAAALDVLHQLADGEDDVARVALARAVLHAEDSTLSDIEADRVRALLSRRDDDVARARFEGLLAFDAADASGARTDPEADSMTLRAKAVLEGLAPGPRPSGGRALTGWLGLAVVHAVRERRVSEARAHLRDATSLVESGARIEAALWTAADTALRLAPEATRGLIRALIARHGGEPPPRGYLSLADALHAIGAEAECIALLRRAARRREPRARECLASHLRHAGWVAAAQGRRGDAISLLREAKRLAS